MSPNYKCPVVEAPDLSAERRANALREALLDLTIVVTVRERFSLSRVALEAIYATVPYHVRVIFVAGGAPRRIGAWLVEHAPKLGFDLIERPYFLTPNESRNLGLAAANTKFVVFIENDVIPSAGWLDALVQCALETNAEIVAPLICEGVPMHKTIHQAGGTFAEDPAQFFATAPGQRRIKESHILQGQPIGVVPVQYAAVQNGEFHCILIRREFLGRLGGFDEAMMSTREHLDFAMAAHRLGATIMLAPASIVTFLIPWAGKSLEWADMHFHMVRWSPGWAKATIEHFRSKWGIEAQQRQDSFVSWRYGADIVKPLVRKIPLLGRSELVCSAASRAIVPLLRALGEYAAGRANQRRAAAQRPTPSLGDHGLGELQQAAK